MMRSSSGSFETINMNCRSAVEEGVVIFLLMRQSFQKFLNPVGTAQSPVVLPSC